MDDSLHTFDENGIPLPKDKPPSARSAERRKKSDGRTSSRPKSTPAASLLNDSVEITSQNGELSDMFHMNGHGLDVTASFVVGEVRWDYMNKDRMRKRSGNLTSFFRRRRSSSSTRELQNHVKLSKVFGACIKRRQKAGQKENEGYVLGIGLFTFEHKDPNVMQVKEVYFEHPSVEICTKWTQQLGDYIYSIPNRPKNVKLFLQRHAGDNHGKSIYKSKILPIFKTACIAVDLSEIVSSEQVMQDMMHINLDDFDCIIAMGGDGTVNAVMNALLNKSQKEADVEMKHGFMPVKALKPLGIIPVGKTNHIAHSVMGTADPATAALHIVFGHWTPVDVCSIYTPEIFTQWAFNCQYGFAGNVLKFMTRYSALGSRKIEAAFLKALTSSKLRSYDCEIEYIPSPNVTSQNMSQVCRTGCQLCSGIKQERESSSPVKDVVQELHLDDSTSSIGSVIELSQESPWSTVKGSFMNVCIFSLPGNCDIAPQGLSKFTHLSDGNIDLVLVKKCDRKDFIRFLRRHGNSKNQFDLPFIQVIRCKEVRFRPRIPSSWNYNDHSFSEIQYQMSQAEKLKKGFRSVEVINDLDSNMSSPERQMTTKTISVQALDVSDDDDDNDDDADDIMELGSRYASGQRDGNETENSIPAAREGDEPSKFQYVGTQYRQTFAEAEIKEDRR
ncbi:ceramide kinase-like isoform X2 [Pomacea canaliculata]|uniref:ceramide kinase-like isoform X2 n=1 Tax=Pomacea canaliculata TaxID=400727 RepID=UPI000D7271B1|nr:ceramide kinase-like isoform X2 [Pomacea canaliculata]